MQYIENKEGIHGNESTSHKNAIATPSLQPGRRGLIFVYIFLC